VHSVIIGPRTYEQALHALDSDKVEWSLMAEDYVDKLVPPGCHSGSGFFDTNYFPVTGRVVETQEG